MRTSLSTERTTAGSSIVLRTSGGSQNVFSDTSVDQMTGGNDNDWFLGNVLGTGTLDKTDKKSGETVTDL